MSNMESTEIAGKNSGNTLPKIVFFDNGFIRHLLAGDFNSQMDDLNSGLRREINPPWTPWRTPFSLMEWIGLNSERLPKPPAFDPGSGVWENFIEPAYRHYEAHYQQVEELRSEDLRRKASEQTERVHPSYQVVWESMIGGVFQDPTFSDALRFALAFDAVHKLDVGPPHRSDYRSDLIAGGFFRADIRIRNRSKFRLAYRMWIRTRDQLTGFEASPEQKACIEETHRLLNVGNWKDYLDGDLVHLAVNGAEDESGRHRVTCLTCDRPEVVEMRIRLYKGFLSFVGKLYRAEADAEGFPEDFESSRNGEVVCFDDEGNLVRRILVATDTPSLHFLGGSEWPSHSPNLHPVPQPKVSRSAMHEFVHILDLFNRLPQTPRKLTFMDVAGYPHYENVCSNILGFYLDPEEDHGLGDLMIQSLISLHEDHAKASGTLLKVMREYPTAKGGRLDLFLQGDTFVVGIENKVFHWLANDLEDYSATIDLASPQGGTRLKFVLGLEPIKSALPGGFRSITYVQLWEAVETRLGTCLAKANPKWVQYLLDFIQTTRKLSSTAMNESLPNDQFFIENNEAIERLISERSNFIERLNTRVAQLKALVCEDAELRSLLSQDPWIYIRSVLVMDFAILEGRKPIALDLGISTSGWELTIFGRSGGESYLAHLVDQCPQLQDLRSCERASNGRRIAKRWDLDTKIEEIHAFLAQFIRKVDEAMRAREEAPSPQIQS